MLEIIYGDDRLEIEAYRDKITRKWSSISELDEVLKRANQYSLIEKKQYLICSSTQSEIAQKLKPETIAKLQKSPNHLLLLTSTWQKNKKPSYYLKGAIKEFSLPQSWNTRTLKAWVNKYSLNNLALYLEPKEIDYIVNANGNDKYLTAAQLRTLSFSSLSKLDDADKRHRLIESIIPQTKTDCFELGKALVRGDYEGARAKLQVLEQNKIELSRVLGILSYQFEMWLKIKVCRERDNKSIAKFAGVSGNPNRVYYLQQDIAYRSLDYLYRISLEIDRTRQQLYRGRFVPLFQILAWI